MNTEMPRRFITPLVRGLLVCLLCYSGYAAAAAVTETGSTDWSSPQAVQVPADVLTISGVINGTWEAPEFDIDFYAFDATAGDFPMLRIVGAMAPDCTGFPSNIALYDSAGNLLTTTTASDCPGADALISNVTLQATGRYIVGVSSFTHYFIDRDGVVDNTPMPTPGGPYQLLISGVRNPNPPAPPVESPPPVQPPPVQPPPVQPPPVQPPPSAARHVPIEVRHWHQEERDLGKRRGMDPITVVILSMGDSAVDKFDAMTVDPNSLMFGSKGDEKSLFRCQKNGRDINHDGLPDLVCYFKPDVASFQADDMNGVLNGKTKSGQAITGKAALKIFSVPRERRGFKRHGHHDHDGDGRRNGDDKGKR